MGSASLLFVWILCVCTPAFAQASPPPQTDQVFSVTTDLVLLDVQVERRKNGVLVGGLTAEDFEAYEDGVKQQIVSLSRDTLPLSVVFLFDWTDSVIPVLKPLADGALEALRHFKPEDEIAVMVYQSSAELLQGFTTEREPIVAAIQKASERTSPSEAAFFNEGVFQAAARLKKATNPDTRRVVIWLTDNVPNIPNSSVHSEREALDELFEGGAAVCALLERSAMSNLMTVLYKRNPAFAHGRKAFPPGDVYRYADETGGQVLTSGKKDVSTKLALLIDQIRSRYTLGYHPSTKQPDGHFCRTEVKVTPAVEKSGGAVRVRARQGYFRPGNDRTGRCVTVTQ